MSGRRVLALYAALLFGFAGVLCRLFYLASRTDYAARAAAQSAVTLELPARRGGFYDCMGLPLTGLEKRWLALCFPGQENYTRLYACTDTAGQELLYRSRSRAAPFLVEVDRDMTALGIPCYAASRRYAAAPLCPQLLGYLDGEGHGAAGLEKALDALLTGSGARDTLLCPVTAQGTLRTGEQVQHLQADSGAVGVRLTLSRSVQRAAEAVAAQTMTTGCILVLDVRTAALRACVSVPGFDPADPAASLEAPDSPFLNRALQAYAVGSVFKPVLAAAALEAGLAPEYDCNGAVVVDGQIFRCAGGVPHGEVDLSAALAKSCNGYFIRLGQQLGAQALLQQAQALGFGRSIGLAEGLTAQSGALPGAEELAQSGQLANFSFGQGSLLATPLQVAAMMNTIANGGVYRAPCPPAGRTGAHGADRSGSAHHAGADGGRGHGTGCFRPARWGGGQDRYRPDRAVHGRRERAHEPVVRGVLPGRGSAIHHRGLAGRTDAGGGLQRGGVCTAVHGTALVGINAELCLLFCRWYDTI